MGVPGAMSRNACSTAALLRVMGVESIYYSEKKYPSPFPWAQGNPAITKAGRYAVATSFGVNVSRATLPMVLVV